MGGVGHDSPVEKKELGLNNEMRKIDGESMKRENEKKKKVKSTREE